MLLFGPGDFSHALGAIGQMDHPEVTEARRRVAEAAVANGKVAATVGSTDDLPYLIDLGYRFINLGADVIAVGRYCRNIRAKLEKIPDFL